MATWIRQCGVCNAGLCEQMQYLTDPKDKGGLGLSDREAARQENGLLQLAPPSGRARVPPARVSDEHKDQLALRVRGRGD